MGIIQKQGIASALITYAGIAVGFVSLLVVQPFFLNTEAIGLTRVLYSFSFLVSTILPLGFLNITTRYFPKFRSEDSRHRGFFGLMIFWLCIGCLVVFPVLYFFRGEIIQLYSEDSPLFSEYFMLVFPFSLIIALLSLLNNYLFSVFKPLLPSFMQEVAIRLFFIVLILLYFYFDLSIETLILGFLSTYLLQLLAVTIYTVGVGRISLIPDKSFVTRNLINEMLRYGWMVFPAGVASMAIKLLDAVVLGQFVSLSLVGIYSIAAFIPIFIEAPINALDKVANARISHSWEKNDLENIQEIYYKSSRYLFILGGFLFLMVSLNAEHLFHFLPNNFMAGVPVVGILSLSALFNLMTGSNSAIIFTSEKFTAGAIGLILVAVLNLVLLYTLIPVFGIEGAAWATCSASFAYNLFKYLYIWKKFNMQPFDKRTIFIGLSILFTYFIVSFIPLFNNFILNIMITSSSVLLVYGVLIWFSKVADDLKEMIPFFKR